jgi:hypothetical protein
MKTILTILGLVLTITVFCQTEQYKVIKVQGEIQRIKTGNLLSTGDEFESNENLKFRTDFSRAAVISPLKGRFILTSQGNPNNNTLYFLPPVNNLSSRAGTCASASDILENFNGDVLFLGTDSLKYDASKIQLDQNNYFIISYKNENNDVSTKLVAENGNIVVVKDSIFKGFAPKVAQIKFQSSTATGQANEFTPVFPEKEKLISEVNLIIANSTGKSKKEIIEDVATYLNDFYGKVSVNEVNQWMKINFNY